MCWVVLGEGRGAVGYQPGVYVPLKAFFLVFTHPILSHICRR